MLKPCKLLIYTISFSILTSCSILNKSLDKKDTTYGELELGFLNQFKLTEYYENDTRVKKYIDIGLLVKSNKKGKLDYFLNDTLIYSKSKGDSCILTEIFKKRYLLISISHFCGAAGPDTFERDMMYIFDLFSEKKGKANMEGKHLTRNKNIVDNYYSNSIDTYTIDQIDFLENKLILYNPMKNTLKIKIDNL